MGEANIIMGCNTNGMLRGYIRHEKIFEFIKQNWDANARDEVRKHIICPLTQCKGYYKLNEHSEDNEYWYAIKGYIYFRYNRELRRLFYVYENVDECENREFADTETTFLSLGYNENSVELIKALVKHFGGGWIDENTCDDENYYLIENDFERGKTHMNEEKTQLLKNYVDSLSYEVKELKTLLSNKDSEILESKKGKIQADIDCAVANLEDIKRLLGEAGLYVKY